MKKCFHDKISQPVSILSVYPCSVFDLNRLCKGYSSMSGSKPSAFHGQQIKPGNVVTALQGWLPCVGEFMEYGKQYRLECKPTETIISSEMFHKCLL